LIRLPVILNYSGRITVFIGIAMLSSVVWSVYYEETIIWRMMLASGITIASGLLLSGIFRHSHDINYREGFAIVTLGWVTASLFGTLPYLLSGYMPSFADAFFETMSGFTTTGASILIDVESMPRGLLYWRSITQWLGGMGIMALFVAMIVGLGVRANQIFRAEVPGPVSDKISPRIRETARMLWSTYIIISAALFVLLYIFGMDLFDAVCHTFTTMATGGFSTKNASIAYFQSPLIQWTIIIFMFIAGVNFSLHYLALSRRNVHHYVKDREFLLYSIIVVIAVAVCMIALSQTLGFEENLRISAFQVVSIITTTGFATVDYNQWVPSAQGVLLLIMLIGGCAGSTSGNIKVGRYMIMLQRAKIEFKQMIHPRAMISLRFGDKVLHDSLVINVLQFFFLYILLVLTGTIIMAILGLDLLTSFSAVVASIGNIGPGFNLVGPAQNYAFIPDIGKYFLAIMMLVGRLEIYPVLILLIPQYWQR